MKWFQGAIPEAIQAAKNNQSVFIVFISGGDESSADMESYLHQEEVTAVCEENKCVALKLDSDGNDCNFFSQIFPVVVIPSTFFIAGNGTPLEVIGECKSAQDFLDRVKAAIALQKESSSQSVPQQQQAGHSSHHTEGTHSDELGEGAVAGASAGNDQVSPQKKAKTDDMSVDEKVERAKHLIEEKQEQKAIEEKEETKRKEAERRKMGQDVQRLRQSQKELEMIEAKKELKKDKEEDRLARQRVKEQIARDRAEKNARFSEAKQEKDRAAEESRKQKLLEEQAAAAARQAQQSATARLQFRLPDGASITQQFDATDRFAVVRDFITGRVGHSISLSTTFPRRTYSGADDQSTLQDLGLAPSAAILVIPGGLSRSNQVTKSGGGVMGLLFAPFLFVWNIIASLFGMGSPSAPSSSAHNRPVGSQSGASTATGGDRHPGGARQRETSSRQEGGIRTVRDVKDDDDDMATYNGNSTQQL